MLGFDWNSTSPYPGTSPSAGISAPHARNGTAIADEHTIASLSVLLHLSSLLLALLCGFLVKKLRIKWLPEAAASMFAGKLLSISPKACVKNANQILDFYV